MAVLAGVCQGQIGGLSTNRDGSELLFTTSLSLKDSPPSPVAKLFTYRGGVLTQGLRLENMQFFAGTPLSSDGRVRVINVRTQCSGGSSCLFRELASASITTPTRRFGFDGSAVVSRNGRWAAIVGNTNQAPGVTLRPRLLRIVNLETGAEQLVGGQPAEHGELIADDGSFLALREGSMLRLVRPTGAVDLPIPAGGVPYLSPDASRVLYNVAGANPELRSYDVAARQDRSLGRGFAAQLADDGVRYSFLKDEQVWIGDANAATARRLTSETEGIAAQTLTGDGSRVFAATRTGRLLVVDTGSGAVTQLLAPPPRSVWLLTPPVPGSYNEIRSQAVDIRIGGLRPVVLGPSPRGIAIQIPWEAQPGDIVSTVAEDSVWAQSENYRIGELYGAALPVATRGPGGPAIYALHEDWSRFVTPGDPARPGEVIHLFGTGYGPVDGAVPTGQPTPSDGLYRMTTSCTWRAIGTLSNPREFEVLFAGLAPGMVGLYQFDFRIPEDWSHPAFNAFCQFPGPGIRFLPTVAVEVQP